MRVVTWNIRARGPARTAGIAARLDDLDADIAVVGAVPANGVGAKLRGFLADAGFEHQLAGEPPPRGTGLLVASRCRITAGEVDGPPVPASWLDVVGLPFRLGAVYAPGDEGDPATAGARARTLAWLVDAVAGWRDRPALLCGDLGGDASGSSGPRGGHLDGLLEDGWRDLFREATGERRSSPRPAARGRRHPDHALASPAFGTPRSVAYGEAGGLTDHRPLVVDVAC